MNGWVNVREGGREGWKEGGKGMEEGSERTSGLESVS